MGPGSNQKWVQNVFDDSGQIPRIKNDSKMILMIQGRFPLQSSALFGSHELWGVKVANNGSNSIEFGRSLGGGTYIYIYAHLIEASPQVRTSLPSTI